MGSTKYKIITAYSAGELESKVNAAIDESYAPHGSLSVIEVKTFMLNPDNTNEPVKFIYSQAMLKL